MKKRNRVLGKRALSLALSLAMCLGMVCTTAFAEEAEVTPDEVVTEPSVETASDPDAVTDTGVPVVVTPKEPEGGEDTDVSTEGWTASGTDDNGVKVEIDSTTTTTTIEGEDEDIPGAVKTETEMNTTLTDEGKLDEENAIFDKGEEPELKGNGPEKLDSDQANLSVNLEASATVKPSQAGSASSKPVEITDDQLESILDKDSGYDNTFVTQTDADGNFTGYVKETNEDGVRTITTITPKKDDNGNVIGYTKTTRTETTEMGNFEETSRGEATEADDLVMSGSSTSEDPLPTEVKVERPEVGDTVERDGNTETVSEVEYNEETGLYTITYTYQVPAIDDEGNRILDDEGNPAFVDMTRTEIRGGESETTSTQQTVTETRKDKVTITEVTVEKEVILGDEKGDNTSLNVELVMEPVEYEFGEGGHATVYEKKDGTWDKMPGTWISENETGDANQETQLKWAEEKFNLITIDEISTTTVTVKQEKANDTEFKADVEVGLSINKSKLDGNRLMLVVQQGDTTKTACLYENGQNDIGVTLQYNDDGDIVGVKFADVKAENFSLQLYGYQKVDNKSYDTGYAKIDMTTNIKVTVSGVKAQINGTKETKTGDRIDTTTAHRTETQTVISSYVTSTLYDGTAVPSENPDEPDDGGNGGGGNTDPIIPDSDDDDDDDDITTPDGDDDDDDDTTAPVVIPDTDVPLVEEPVIDVPEVEVPLVEEPVVDIQDEEVPLVETPSEVVIADGDVPLAEVPKTGDISVMWYALTILSACGLMALRVLRKDEEA